MSTSFVAPSCRARAMTAEGQEILASIKALTELMALQFKKKEEAAAAEEVRATAAGAARDAGGQKGHEGKTTLRLKDMKISDYSGLMEDWDDLWFSFKKACKTQSKKVLRKTPGDREVQDRDRRGSARD